jgi:iron complex transport system ATP-binding protein
MTVAVGFAGATVGYEHAVVSDASLDVARGEIVGLIGPNGAGKTTMLRAVTGGATVLGGDVLVEGRRAHAYTRAELARIVGVLPQASSQSFAFTARQFVEMGRHARLSRFGGLGPHDREAVERALALTDTEGLAGELVDTLSGGDLQRLTLAQALAQEPRVLLLDEPTSHLDLNHRLQVLDVVRQLADGGLAVLAVFHDLDMAARYSDRLAVVASGTLRDAEPPEKVLTSQILRDVFGVRAVIGTDPVTGSVQVVPVVRSVERAARRGSRVMVVSGSGSGAALMRRLVIEGFEVVAGALARGDTDERVASALDVQFTALAPYGEMSAEDEAGVRETARKAGVAVVCATPFGPANLGNLRAVARSGARIVLVGDLAPEDDFTHGEARRLWMSMERAGVVVCEDPRRVSECVEEAMRR